MPDSVYKVIKVIGSSPTSWEEAAKHAVEEAAKTVHDLRIAEVDENSKVVEYRAKVNISFRYGSD